MIKFSRYAKCFHPRDKVVPGPKVGATECPTETCKCGAWRKIAAGQPLTRWYPVSRAQHGNTNPLPAPTGANTKESVS